MFEIGEIVIIHIYVILIGDEIVTFNQATLDIDTLSAKKNDIYVYN